MKSLVTVLIVASGMCGVAVAAGAPDSLQKTVPATYSYASLGKAIPFIERQTGYNVVCREAIAEAVRDIPIKGAPAPTGFGNTQQSQIPVSTFLNQVCTQLVLVWKSDAGKKEITFDLPWKTNPARSPDRLLAFVMDTGYPQFDFGSDERWYTAFETLISNDSNIKKAWKAFVPSIFGGYSFGGTNAGNFVMTMDPIVRGGMTDASGGKHFLILLNKPAAWSPENGTGDISYYWFKEDGTLEGAASVTAGRRCDVVDAAIDNAAGKASELHLVLQKGADVVVARFVLEADGLKLIHLMDAGGREIAPGDIWKPRFTEPAMGAAAAPAEKPPEALQKKIPAHFDFKSFDEAMQLIAQRTGFKVNCPKEIVECMKTASVRAWPWTDTEKAKDAKVTIVSFLNRVCSTLLVDWTFDAAKQEISLDFPWKNQDPRPPAELLRFLMDPGYTSDNYGYDNRWTTAFETLLTTGVNLQKAWKPFMNDTLGMIWIGDEDELPMHRSVSVNNPIVRGKITGTSGEEYDFILLYQDSLFCCPPDDQASYYWFKKDGTLVGTGQLDFGYHGVADAAIESGPGKDSGPATELHMVLWGDPDFWVARLALAPEGLKVIQIINTRGREIKPGSGKDGRSLIDASLSN